MKKWLCTAVLLITAPAFAQTCTTTVSTVAGITSAFASAGAGSVVCVSPGTYNMNGTITTYATGTAGSHVTFKSTTKWGAKLIVTGVNGWLLNGAYEDVIGFDISCGATNACNGLFKGSRNNLRVIGNRIHDQIWTTCAPGSGIMFGGGSEGSQALGNLIFNIGLPPGSCNKMHGIYISTANDVLSNNVIVNVGNNGIQLYSGTTSGAVISGNTIVGAFNGLELNRDYPSTGLVVTNNILVGNREYAIYNCSSGDTISNNLLFNNGPIVTCSSTVSNTVAADPKFVNGTGTGVGDYHLQASSPAIAAGTSVGAPTTDFDGVPRGNPPSIGAYEFVNQAPSLPTLTGLTAEVTLIWTYDYSKPASAACGTSSCVSGFRGYYVNPSTGNKITFFNIPNPANHTGVISGITAKGTAMAGATQFGVVAVGLDANGSPIESH